MFQHTNRKRYTIKNNQPSLTKQSEYQQSDIHYIMKQFERNGVMNHLAQHEGTYGDYADLPTYHEAQNLIAEANSMFETVPASIRELHDNDPSKFVSWMMDSKNREAMLEQGFTDTHLPPVDERQPTPKPAPAPAEPTPAPAEPPAPGE